MGNKTLMVEAIENGTVIDHIPLGQALKIIEMLALREFDYPVTVGLNLESKKLGKKDIIKVSGRFLSELEASEIAVFAPKARINIIRDYQVIEKMTAVLPQELKKILLCPNDRCVSRSEAVDSLFHIEAIRGDIRLTCHYCERVFLRPQIQEYRT